MSLFSSGKPNWLEDREERQAENERLMRGTSLGGTISRTASSLYANNYSDLMMRYMTSMAVDYRNQDDENGNDTTAKAVEVMTKIKKSAKPMAIGETDGHLEATKADEFRALGLVAIANVLEKQAMKTWKELAIATAGYTRINHEELEVFKEELRKSSGTMAWKRELVIAPLESYIGQNVEEGQVIDKEQLGVPPTEILDLLKVAQTSKLFDEYVVLSVKRVPDPILCGKINESKDLYFIGEWGDDVKLSDIVKDQNATI